MDIAQLSENMRDRATSVFDYLVELTRLRTKTICDIRDYEDVFWFNDLPSDKDCYTIAWGQDTEEHSEDVWLEIGKQNEPPCPIVPSECMEWLDIRLLGNSDEPPKLYDRIAVPSAPASESENIVEEFLREPEFVNLSDRPQVRGAFESYLNKKWLPWSEIHQAWKKVQAAYSSLFKIHQQLQRLGEQYELIVGLGLLTWKTPEGEAVRRHALVAQATLDFDAAKGVFTIRPGAEGARLRLETDMLQPGDRPAAELQHSLEASIQTTNETPWDRSAVIPILKAWVQSLDNRGEFGDELAPQYIIGQNPKIHFAPALVLRKRSGQNALTALEKIIRQIRELNQPIPSEIIRLVSDPDDFERCTSFENEGDGQFAPADPEPTYFPLLANREQLRIVESLRRKRGVLVQGPPGTGKSHTIANLICHLLATGQRVLVTAQTPRALRVLQDKLPEEIAPLCVSLLGNDRTALQGLEFSVSEISNRHARWDAARNKQEVERLESDLDQTRKRLARLKGDARSLREAETRNHEIAERSYRGTAQAIAARLANEAPNFDWFRDKIAIDQPLPFGPTTFGQLRTFLLDVDTNRLAELKQQCPTTAKLLSVGQFVSCVQQEKQALHAAEAFAAFRQGPNFLTLQHATEEACKLLADSVRALRVAVKNIERRPSTWIHDAILGVLTAQESSWKSLRQMTSHALSGLKERSMQADQFSIAIQSEIAEDQLLSDATDLLSHLKAGKGFGWFIFRSRVVRRTMYVSKQVRLNGRLCANSEALESLIEGLETRRTVDRLWNLWIGKIDRKQVALALQVSLIEEELESLDAILAIEPKLIEARRACALISGLGEPPWHVATELDDLLRACEAALAHHKLEKIRSALSQQLQQLSAISAAPNAHPVTRDLIEAITSRDVDAFGRSLDAANRLKSDIEKVQLRSKGVTELSESAPILAKDLCEMPEDVEWKQRFEKIADAWNWARANSWLESFLKPGREAQLEIQIAQAQKECGQLMQRLAATKAWGHFFRRMTEGQRQHLNAWQQAIKKIGKGTGKHAGKHRRHAQEHLDKCREAIPAWIMPLFRVLETISPSPEMFDVLIVDEASQCGPDALILLYLAKKIIVVGDDQQISPEAVGVNQDDVDFLIRQHLTEIDHSDSFGVTSSLFDHGVIRYGNRIVLREHFRCMPEIIRFSNDLSYSNNPLVPLRQYPPNRLKPIVTHHLRDGYREGSSSRAFNRPEAEAVVRAIVACCNDPRFEGRTMGVMSLQGDAQARLIESLLLTQLDAKEIEDRRLICGDAYSFQGDERDVMFLSLVAAPNERIGVLNKESDKRRFNVAASRARDQLWLFHSASLDDLSSSCLRHELLRYCLNPVTQKITLDDINVDELHVVARNANRTRQVPPSPFESWFEVDVFLRIIARGYRVIPQYHFAEYRIDLVVEGVSARLAVECDGDEFHGAENYQSDLERQRILERSGWKFWRVRGSEFYRDPDAALMSLWSEIEARRIEIASDQFKTLDIDGYVPEIDWSGELMQADSQENRRAPKYGEFYHGPLPTRDC